MPILNQNILTELNKYIITGVFVFILDLSILYILTEIFNIYYLHSAILSISISFFISYLISIKWIFKFRKYKNNPFFEYLLMILISIFISSLNIVCMWILSDLFNIYYIVSKVISSLFTFITKFIFRKKILFNI